MEVSVFIENIQKAFGEKVQLPFAFWYSDKQINDDLKKINGCFFKEFEKLIGGEPISLVPIESGVWVVNSILVFRP